jgi:hypothetical protein
MITDLYILYEHNNITSLVWHAKMEVYTVHICLLMYCKSSYIHVMFAFQFKFSIVVYIGFRFGFGVKYSGFLHTS